MDRRDELMSFIVEDEERLLFNAKNRGLTSLIEHYQERITRNKEEVKKLNEYRLRTQEGTRKN